MQTSEKNELLDFLKDLAVAISEMFGQDCEVCVSDLSQDAGKVIFIRNGHVTGRSIGSPLTDEARFRVRQSLKGAYINYMKKDKSSRETLKSSSVVRRIGDFHFSVCINYNTTKLEGIQNLLNSFLNVNRKFDDSITFFEGIAKADLRNVLEEHLVRLQKTLSDLNRADRVEIVRDMLERGLFRLKGSISSAANILMITRATLYNYLREIKKSQDKDNHSLPPVM